MRYDIKLLQTGLQEVRKERDDMLRRSFPELHQQEIDKIEAVIKQIKESLKLIQYVTLKTEKADRRRVIKKREHPIIHERYKGGDSLKVLAAEYGVNQSTIIRIVNMYVK